MLNIYELHKKKNARERNRLSYYKRVLHKCYHRIVTVYESCKMECVYKVPEFVVGMPIYNGMECVRFVVKALRKNGFFVKYTHPNLLFISWKNIPESHYPSSQRRKMLADKPAATQSHTPAPTSTSTSNSNKYRDVTDRNHELPYNSRILNSFQGSLRDIMRPN